MKKYYWLIISCLTVILLVVIYTNCFAYVTDTLETPGLDSGTGDDFILALPPVADPPAGSYTSTKSVTLEAPGSTTICYSLSSTPTCSSASVCTGTSYTPGQTISISSGTTNLYTTACFSDGSSESKTYTYTITTTAAPSGGGYTPPTTTTTTLPGTTTTTTTTVPSEEDAVSALQARIAEIRSIIDSLMRQLGLPVTTTTTVPPVTIPPVTITGIPPGFTFKNNLSQGMISEDVRYLQRFLNSHPGTKLADTGVGSSGKETNYFGALTKAAVIKFQNMYAPEVLAQWGLTKGNGYVGSSTRGKLNELLK